MCRNLCSHVGDTPMRLSAEVKPKSVIRPCMDFLDYFLRSFGFYKMPFACF